MLCGSTINERLIRSLKRKALKRIKTLARDPETQEVIQTSKFSGWLSKLKTPFTRAFLEDLFESTDN
jgi:sodium/potassium-transporting ATPase subunit alpha